MQALENNPAYSHRYDFNTTGDIEAGVLSLADYTPSGDLGNPDRVTWASTTRNYLNTPGNNRNVVIWSWCGQVSPASEADINTYLNLMNQLERDFPDVKFVYMTGHLDGGDFREIFISATTKSAIMFGRTIKYYLILPTLKAMTLPEIIIPTIPTPAIGVLPGVPPAPRTVPTYRAPALILICLIVN